MKRHVFSAIVMTFVLVLVGTPFVEAGPSVLDKIVERGELRVGMTGSQPPLNVKNKTGELIGYEVDLVNLMAESMGVKANLVVKPFAQLIPALRSGEIDMVVSGMTITLERNTQVAFVGPYLVSGKSILTKSSTLAAIEDSGDINEDNVSLVALEGSTSQQFVETIIPKAKLTKAPDYGAAVKLLLDDKVNAMVADMEICVITALRYPDAGLATLTAPLTIEPIGIALPPNDPLLINLVENYLGALEATGLLDQLHAKWFENGAWLLQVP